MCIHISTPRHPLHGGMDIYTSAEGKGERERERERQRQCTYHLLRKAHLSQSTMTTKEQRHNKCVSGAPNNEGPFRKLEARVDPWQHCTPAICKPD